MEVLIEETFSLGFGGDWSLIKTHRYILNIECHLRRYYIRIVIEKKTNFILKFVKIYLQIFKFFNENITFNFFSLKVFLNKTKINSRV